MLSFDDVSEFLIVEFKLTFPLTCESSETSHTRITQRPADRERTRLSEAEFAPHVKANDGDAIASYESGEGFKMLWKALA